MAEKDSTTVIVSSDTAWDYSLLLPWTCLFWRDMVGYGVRALLAGDEREWMADSCAKVALSALRMHGIEHRFVPQIEGHRSCSIAQNARQHAAADPSFPEDHWIMVEDADMWPIQRDLYRRHEGRTERLVHYNAYGDYFVSKEHVLQGWTANVAFQSIPSYHFAMRARTWRDIYRYASPDVGESLRHTFETVLRPRMEGHERSEALNIAWHFDQYYVTERVCRQDWFPGEAFLLRGGHPRGHIAPWDLGGQWEGGLSWSWVDIHVRKGIYAEGRWKVLLPIIDRLLPQYAEWARTYFNEAVGDRAY